MTASRTSIVCGILVGTLLALLAIPSGPALAQEKEPFPVEDLRFQGNDRMRYFLMGPKEGATRPKPGYGLVLVLPGGPGGADFLTFVKNIYDEALDDEFLLAQLVSVHWTENPKVIWPTSRSRAAGMKFTTEEFVDAVLGAIRKRHRIDAKRVYLLAWSSSGPATYLITLENRRIAGAFIAMSVFPKDRLPSLKSARGRPFFLLQSPEDEKTRIHHAEEADRELRKAGARVKFVRYSGGHGWQGNVYGMLREGFAWLEKNRRK